MSLRAAAPCALVALTLVPAALADHTRDLWEGTWRASGLARTLVLKPAADARTRAQAPPCAGSGRTLYAGAYSGSRSGTIAACAQRYTLAGRLYEGGRRVGAFEVAWSLPVSPDGTLGTPAFSGTYTIGSSAPWSGTWLRHGGTLPKATRPQAGLSAAQAAARVQAILRKNASGCRMTWTKVTAQRTANGWLVTAAVRTFGNPGKATWNVVGTRVAAADQLAAEIEHGCP